MRKLLRSPHSTCENQACAGPAGRFELLDDGRRQLGLPTQLSESAAWVSYHEKTSFPELPVDLAKPSNAVLTSRVVACRVC